MGVPFGTGVAPVRDLRSEVAGGWDRFGVAAGVALVSIAADGVVLAGGHPYSQGMILAGKLGLAKPVVLLVLTVLVVRRARAGVARRRRRTVPAHPRRRSNPGGAGVAEVVPPNRSPRRPFQDVPTVRCRYQDHRRAVAIPAPQRRQCPAARKQSPPPPEAAREVRHLHAAVDRCARPGTAGAQVRLRRPGQAIALDLWWRTDSRPAERLVDTADEMGGRV